MTTAAIIIMQVLMVVGAFILGFRSGANRVVRAWMDDNIKAEINGNGIKVTVKGKSEDTDK